MCPNRLEDAFKRRYAVVMGQKSGLFPDLSAADAFLVDEKACMPCPKKLYRERAWITLTELVRGARAR